MLQAPAAATLRSPLPMGSSAAPFIGMQRVPSGTNIINYLYPDGVLHVANLADEAIEGGRTDFVDRAGAYGSRGSALGQALEVYKPRMAAALPIGSGIGVPEGLVQATRANLDYLRRLELTELPDEAVIGVPMVAPRFSASVLAASATLLTGWGHPRYLLPFIHSPETAALAQALGLETDASVATVNLANHKGAGYEALSARGLRVPFGAWVHTADDARGIFSAIKARGASTVYGKLARAVSGYGVWALETAADLERFLCEERVQLQLGMPELGIRLDEGIEPASLPNVMVYVGHTPAEDRFISASRQILEPPAGAKAGARPTIHIGNVGPLTPAEEASIWEPIHIVAGWLRSIGAFGLSGTDFVIDAAGVAWWLEINFRMNGNNPGGFPAIGAGAAVWAAHNTVPVREGTTLDGYRAFLRRQGIAYDRTRRTGVFVVNASTGVKEKMQIGVIAWDHDEAGDFLRRAAQMPR